MVNRVDRIEGNDDILVNVQVAFVFAVLNRLWKIRVLSIVLYLFDEIRDSGKLESLVLANNRIFLALDVHKKMQELRS